jgi:hypothetical protein
MRRNDDATDILIYVLWRIQHRFGTIKTFHGNANSLQRDGVCSSYLQLQCS